MEPKRMRRLVGSPALLGVGLICLNMSLAGGWSFANQAFAEPTPRGPQLVDYGTRAVAGNRSMRAGNKFHTKGCARLTGSETVAATELADRIEKRIADQVKGYSIAVAKDCRLAAAIAGGTAITANDTGKDPEPMTVDHRSAMGSVAKAITAITILQALEAQGIDPDSDIKPFLDMFWDLDALGYTASLSWTSLLNQTSGINSSNTTSELSYEELGSFLWTAQTDADFRYDNANAGILRVLLWGLMFGSAPVGNPDQIEAVTAQYFQAHVRTLLFSAISIADAQCGGDGAASHAYQYGDSQATDGWLPSTSQSMEWCGPGGWFLSAIELLKMGVYLRHTDLFMSFAMLDRMDLDRLGWDTPTDNWPDILTEKEHIRFKAGELVGRACVMDFMNGTEVAVVINSTDMSGPALCADLADAYYDPGVWQ